MPFMPRDPRQYRPGNPGQEWLNQLRSGGRITASLPLLDATGSFTDRLKAPGWRERQAAGQRARAASGTYAEPQSRIPGAPTPGTLQASARPSATPSVASVISSLRPRGQGFIEEVAQGPPMTDRPPERVYPNPLAPGGYSPMPGAAPSAPPDRTDVGDGGGGGGFGGYVGAPGFGTALIGAGGAMMEAAGQPGATFGGSLGTGLKGFAAERARYGASEAARRQAAQAGQTPPQELRDRQNTVRAMLAQRQIPQDQWPQYLARVVTQKGYEGVLDELAPPGAADPTTATARNRDITDMQAARATVRGLITDGVPEDDPRMIAAKQAVNDWELQLGITQLPQVTPQTADRRNWDHYVELKQAEDPTWVPTAAEYQTFQTETPSQYGPNMPGPGQLAAETRRIASYDDWFIGGRGAQFEKNLDTFNEVLFDLDARIADGQIQGSSDWDNDDGSGFFQAMKGALVSRRPFMAAALTADDTNTLDLVRAVVFQSLKETLGGQFAEREAENLVRAAYNPMLPPEVNRRRIRRLMTELRSTDHYMNSMAEYYHRTGELAFYTHENAEDAWDLAVETGEVAGLGSSVINPLEYGGLGEEEIAAAMEFDLGNLTQAQRDSLAYKLSGGQPYANLEQALDPLAYQMIEAIRRMGRR